MNPVFKPFAMEFKETRPRGSLFPYAVEVNNLSITMEQRIFKWLAEYLGPANFAGPNRRWYARYSYFAFRDLSDMVLFVTAWAGEMDDA